MAGLDLVRKLNPYEVCLTDLNISAVMGLRQRIPIGILDQALEDLCQAMPFLAFILHDQQLHYDPGLSTYVRARPLPTQTPSGEDPTQRLERLAGLAREPSQQVLVVYAGEAVDGGTEIYLVLNHAVCDATSFFRICHEFLTLLGEIVAGERSARRVAPRQLIDFSSLLEPDIDGAMPSLPDSYLAPLAAAPGSGEAPDRRIRGIWYALHPDDLQALRDCGHRCGFTVQGALSAATALAFAVVVGGSLPQTILNIAPVDMRPHLPGCDPSAFGPAGVGLFWAQQLHNDTTLSKLAAEARAAIVGQLERRAGQHSLYRMVHKPLLQAPWSAYASSVGVVPLQPLYRGDLHLQDLQMLVGMYRAPAAAAILMTHAFTFAGSLRVAVEYSSPAIPSDLASTYAIAQEQTLRMLIREPGLRLTEAAARILGGEKQQ